MPWSRHVLFPIWVLLAGAWGSGCEDDDFKKIYRVTEFRALAVRAEPPELRRDQETTVEVLWHDPLGRPVAFGWLWCKGDVETGTGLDQCDPLSPELLPPVMITADQGGDSYHLPAIPASIYDTLIAQGESAKATAIILMCAGGQLPPPDQWLGHPSAGNPDALCQDGDGRSAYKNIAVSDNPTPNANPVMEQLSLDGVPLEPAGALQPDLPGVVCVSAGDCQSQAQIHAYLTPQSFQEYLVSELGETVWKTEFLYFSWFITAGKVRPKESVVPGPGRPAEVEWRPKTAGTVTLWAVAHDSRGGTGWQTYELNAQAP